MKSWLINMGFAIMMMMVVLSALPWFNGCCPVVVACGCGDAESFAGYTYLKVRFHLKVYNGFDPDGGEYDPDGTTYCGTLVEIDITIPFKRDDPVGDEGACTWHIDESQLAPDDILDYGLYKYYVLGRAAYGEGEEFDYTLSAETVLYIKDPGADCKWDVGLVTVGDDNSGFGARCYTDFIKDWEDGYPVGEYDRVDVGGVCVNHAFGDHGICPPWDFSDSITYPAGGDPKVDVSVGML